MGKTDNEQEEEGRLLEALQEGREALGEGETRPVLGPHLSQQQLLINSAVSHTCQGRAPQMANGSHFSTSLPGNGELRHTLQSRPSQEQHVWGADL